LTPETPSERVALVVWHLMRGQKLTTRSVATLTGLPMPSAWRMMARLSRVVPVYQDGPVWRMCEEDDAPCRG